MKKIQVEQLIKILSYMDETIRDPSSLSGMEMTLLSGKNRYPVKINIRMPDPKNPSESTSYQMGLIGKKITADPDAFIETIRELAAAYDGLEIAFAERGGGKKIVADDRGVKMTTFGKTSPENSFQEEADHTAQAFHGVSETRDYFIRTDEAGEVLQAIGVLDQNGKLRNDKIRKYHQIDRFVELADPLIREFLQRKEPINILDCACGKSYLSFVLNFYIKEKIGHACSFLGLDWSQRVIDASQELARKLRYENMEFRQCDLSEFRPSGYRPDICMSLHACDTATDLAIFTGIRLGAKAILCVPCCQKELLSGGYSIPALEKNILAHGLLKARFSDLMTDAMRILLMEANGYETTLTEYISPLDSPKNIMIRGRYIGKNNAGSLAEYNRLKKEYQCDITLGKLLEGMKYDEIYCSDKESR